MRIVSFLPSATEMVCALGMEDSLVGITHECDYPAGVRVKPIVVRSALDYSQDTPRQIDRRVAERARAGSSLFKVDEALLRSLAPDLILTQDLCQVCAPSGHEVSSILKKVSHPPEVLYLTPRTLAGIEENLRMIGRATGTEIRAENLIQKGWDRLQSVRAKTAELPCRRVFCVEWVDPVYGTGHWVPEMVRIAGGQDALVQPGGDSLRMGWRKVLAWNPEILLVMPCGYDAAAAREQARLLEQRPGWGKLAAVRSNRVYAVDANAYFARPGPRVIEGAELLAHLIHPESFGWNGPEDAFAHVEQKGMLLL